MVELSFDLFNFVFNFKNNDKLAKIIFEKESNDRKKNTDDLI